MESNVFDEGCCVNLNRSARRVARIISVNGRRVTRAGEGEAKAEER